jgi:hypothetical protein
MFATMSDDGRQATVKATKEEQAALVAAAPGTFGIPAYVGRHGWVSIQLATVDPAELRELVVEAWRQTAPGAWSRPMTRGPGPERSAEAGGQAPADRFGCRWGR